jgi:heme exporter protein C
MKSGTRYFVLILTGLVLITMFVAIWMVFQYVPSERVMGPVQRIFYFHVPSAMITFLAVFILMSASIGYLWTRSRVWDRVAIAATEIGLMFCSLVLITGPIWAKAAWGVWWTWEARLTTTLILWLLLAGCLMVRGYAQNQDLGARLAAVLGIIAALDVVIVYKAVHWWRGQHPIVFKEGAKSPLAPEMMQTFLYCIGVFMALFLLMMVLRVQTLSMEERAQALMERQAGESV